MHLNMFKNQNSQSVPNVRLVINIQPTTAAEIRKIAAKKRSKFVEEAVLKKIADEQKEYAWQHLFAAREAMKGSMTHAQIVRELRTDRRSH